MKKIIVPFEGTIYRSELPGFARLLNTRSSVRLMATFVPGQEYTHAWAENGPTESGQSAVPVDAEKMSARNCARFRRFCDENEIDYTIREDRSETALPHVRKETRFADLLLISGAQFFIGDHPDAFARGLLHGSECPVMLLPPDPWLPGELIFACDDATTASHAIRQFASLFPEFTRLKATLVCIYDNDNAEMTDESAIREFGSRHFKRFRVLRLSRRTDDFYDTWIRMMDSPWLICGASGHRESSPLLSHSFANRMVKGHLVPLFIAHP
jgi:hypothetical protein